MMAMQVQTELRHPNQGVNEHLFIKSAAETPALKDAAHGVGDLPSNLCNQTCALHGACMRRACAASAMAMHGA